MRTISPLNRQAPAFYMRTQSLDDVVSHTGLRRFRHRKSRRWALHVGIIFLPIFKRGTVLFFSLLVISATGVPGAVESDLSWEMFETAFQEKNCNLILNDLEPLVREKMEHDPQKWEKSLFLVGKCHLEQGNLQAALTSFARPYVSIDADIVSYQQVLVHLQAGEKQIALARMRKLLENPRHPYYLKRLRQLLIKYFATGKGTQELFLFLRRYNDRPHLLLQGSKLHQLYLERAERTRQPVSRKVRMLGWLYPMDEQDARQSQRNLWPTDFETLAPDEILLRVKKLQQLGLHPYLIEHLPVLAKDRPSHLRGKLGVIYLQALYLEKQYARILELQWKGELDGEWALDLETQLFWITRTHLKRRRTDDAEKSIQAMKRNSPQSPFLPLLYSSFALLYKTQGRTNQALRWWIRMTEEFPGHYQSIDAYWRIAWHHYRGGRFEKALRQIKAGLTHAKPNQKVRSRFLYWQGKLLARLGKIKQSRKVYLELVSNYPTTYYGLRRMLNEKNSNFSNMHVQSETGNSYNDLPPLTPREQRLLSRVEFLFAVLEDAQAVDEIMDALKHMKSRRLNWEISRMLRRKKQYHTLHRVIANHYLGELSQLDVGGHPLWELAFPRPYWQEIKNTASKAGIDPYFALAVMREESRFDPRAISKSDAMGLMQLMPATARDIARMKKIEIGQLEDVLDPYLNMQLGTHYLGWISSRFNDILIYTAGGYNAGPSNMLRWLRNWRDDSPEEFVEMIPYEETRNYVKRVYRSYLIYRQIYRS